MSAAVTRSPGRAVAGALAELRRRNRVLYAVALANLGLAALFTVLMALDGRTLLGRNVWTKPWKFATSIAVFTATMGWLLPSLSLADRVERLATYTVGAAMSIEIALIAAQAARGVASHFNTATPLDATVFGVMGATITVSSLVVAYVLWRVLRDPPALAPAYRWGIVLGMALFVVASFEGWLMVSRQSHAVGAPNDSPGVTLLNWSVTGGDLRVAHFIGLHALQVLPLTGYLAARWEGLSVRGALGAVGAVATLYGGLVGATFLLALQGTPLVGVLAPWLPASAAAALVLGGGACGTVLLAVLWRRGRVGR